MAIKAAHRVCIGVHRSLVDPQSERILREIKHFLGIPLEGLRMAKVYYIYKALSAQQVQEITAAVLLDPMIEEVDVSEDLFNWVLEVGLKSDCTDNLGLTAQMSIEDYLGTCFQPDERVASATCYLLKGNLARSSVEKIGTQLLANTLIEQLRITPIASKIGIETIELPEDTESLLRISCERHLALTGEEMQTIRAYFQREDTHLMRKKYGLGSMPTDVELQAIAQTWSEHCKHKIFNARITYRENEETVEISSIYATYIKAATEQLQDKIDWLVSVFEDNAGVIRFNEKVHLVCKVETHNSPSALDPYGGALTGILGVNRDILGTGSGARPIANTNVLCFAPPDYINPFPETILHPKRVLLGVCRGIEHGGNKSGIPTINGAIVFDPRFLGKPVVYCGTIGLIATDKEVKKKIVTGDWVAIAGGKTGRDGIHGATFSSEELHENSPSSVVQIGDPFTQKKLHDFLLEAQEKGLFRTLTDNGAGGLSSSVGEMALLAGGCEIELNGVSLKDRTLRPWEILLSESQERMTLAVPFECREALEKLASFHEIHLAFVGTFTNGGVFQVLFQNQTVALLSLDFLHGGVPQLQLKAEWKAPLETHVCLNKEDDLTIALHHMLSRYTICSKEAIVRRYDHEVQGASCLKPFVGIEADGPSDASILSPLAFRAEGEGIVVSNGICPRYSDIDTAAMAAYALNEAISNQICVGADPARIAILDNFCWPDPIYHPEKTPDGRYKLAQLVRAAQSLYQGAIALETPIISGKDSMKNDYRVKEKKISIPPTLLITAVGKIPSIYKAVSMDVKEPGDLVYVVGSTRRELGGSEYLAMKQQKGGYVPRIDFGVSKAVFHALFAAMQQEVVASCHDCSEGGLGVALAESAFAGGWGLDVDLKKVPVEQADLLDAEMLFSESASRFVVTVAPQCQAAFEDRMCAIPCQRIGTVTHDQRLIIRGVVGTVVVSADISELKKSWKTPLKNL